MCMQARKTSSVQVYTGQGRMSCKGIVDWWRIGMRKVGAAHRSVAGAELQFRRDLVTS